jgi:protein SCO1/2
MAQRPVHPPHDGADVRVLDGSFRLVVVLAGLLLVATFARFALGPAGPAGGPGPGPGTGSPSGSATPVDVATYLVAAPTEAPPIELRDPDEGPFSLASLRGEPVFVFFGYTHCPDICPVTTGAVGMAMDAFGPGVRAVFVSVDPERDTPAWLREYVRYLPAGFTALTGTPDAIRSTADAWGVRYARVETGSADAYSMSHTADVYLVDAGGLLRARFQFGTQPETMTAVLREVVANPVTSVPSAGTLPTASLTPAPSTTSPAASARPVRSIDVDVVSTAVWAGNPGPVILDLLADGARLDDPALHPAVQLVDPAGRPVGTAVTASPVQPPGLTAVSYVAHLAIPAPGAWRVEVTATYDGSTAMGTAALTALDPGDTAPLGEPAPTIRTPTLDDVGGAARAVTTDPAPDLRLSQRSTADALADHQPFVLVIDSTRFRVSPACGRAIIMARYLLDRWRDVGFIHLEPYRYQVVSDTPVLDGSLESPILTAPAEAWGVGGAPWGARSMPWVFVVDGDGIVRAKYQGVMGSADVDVILSLIEQGG